MKKFGAKLIALLVIAIALAVFSLPGAGYSYATTGNGTNIQLVGPQEVAGRKKDRTEHYCYTDVAPTGSGPPIIAATTNQHDNDEQKDVFRICPASASLNNMKPTAHAGIEQDTRSRHFSPGPPACFSGNR